MCEAFHERHYIISFNSFFKKYVMYFLAVLALLNCMAFSSCHAQVAHYGGLCRCGAQAQYLWCMDLVALQHVGSSWTRGGTCVPHIGRLILIQVLSHLILVVTLLIESISISIFQKTPGHRKGKQAGSWTYRSEAQKKALD